MIVIAEHGGFTETKITRLLPLTLSSVATFESHGFPSLEPYSVMLWRKFVLLGYAVTCVFVASVATAQMTGQGNSMSRAGMRGGLTPPSIARMPVQLAPMPSSTRRMPMHRAPIINSALGLRRFKHFNQIIVISSFGSPWWWSPWWGWNWGYPYEPYGYGYGNYGYDYGSSGYNYGYVYPSVSYYGSQYNGTNDGNDDERAVRNVLAEYEVSWNDHDMAAFGRLFTEDCDYVNIAGVHWKGAQEIVHREAELFQNRLKTAVRTLTGTEVRFSTPDVALVHTTWDVTGSSHPIGEAVPVLKEITTMVMVKTNGKWLITAFQNTESRGSTK